MDEKRKEEEVFEITADEIDELVFEEQLASGCADTPHSRNLRHTFSESL